MFDLITSLITVYEKGNVLSKEVKRIQKSLLLKNEEAGQLQRNEILDRLYSDNNPHILDSDGERWPLWIESEFRGDDFLTLVSPGLSASSLQDHLTLHLSRIDPHVITLMEWHCWPDECGSRLTYIHSNQLFSIKKRAHGMKESSVMSTAPGQAMWLWMKMKPMPATCGMKLNTARRMSRKWQYVAALTSDHPPSHTLLSEYKNQSNFKSPTCRLSPI